MALSKTDIGGNMGKSRPAGQNVRHRTRSVLSRSIVFPATLSLAALTVSVISAQPALAASTNSSTPVRACTNLGDTGCNAWTTIPSGIGLSLRCWQDESWYDGTNRWFWASGYGVQGFVSANQVSWQYATPWCGNDPYVQAVRWAGSHLGQNYDIGLCLQFVHDAWWVAGRDIGSATTAYNYWLTNPRGYARVYDTNPPVGALVFWRPDAYNSAGHVAISIGSGWVISTEERTTTAVHIFRIVDRNATKPYAGYLRL